MGLADDAPPPPPTAGLVGVTGVVGLTDGLLFHVGGAGRAGVGVDGTGGTELPPDPLGLSPTEIVIGAASDVPADVDGAAVELVPADVDEVAVEFVPADVDEAAVELAPADVDEVAVELAPTEVDEVAVEFAPTEVGSAGNTLPASDATGGDAGADVVGCCSTSCDDLSVAIGVAEAPTLPSVFDRRCVPAAFAGDDTIAPDELDADDARLPDPPTTRSRTSLALNALPSALAPAADRKSDITLPATSTPPKADLTSRPSSESLEPITPASTQGSTPTSDAGPSDERIRPVPVPTPRTLITPPATPAGACASMPKAAATSARSL
jgi:hypothetical protein